MLSSQSREFHTFFAQLIVAATTLKEFAEYFFSRKNFRKMFPFSREKYIVKSLQGLHFSLYSFSQKNAKSLRNANKSFRWKPYLLLT